MGREEEEGHGQVAELFIDFDGVFFLGDFRLAGSVVIKPHSPTNHLFVFTPVLSLALFSAILRDLAGRTDRRKDQEVVPPADFRLSARVAGFRVYPHDDGGGTSGARIGEGSYGGGEGVGWLLSCHTR